MLFLRETIARSCQALVKAGALKGQEKVGHKYVRRVPDGKGGWRYFYTTASLGRAPTEGEELHLDGRKIKVRSVDDDKVTIEHADGHTEDVTHEDWHRRMTWQYGDKYVMAAEKRARQWAGAILQHVPKELLSELQGSTDAERLEDLKKRAPEIHAKLEPALKRAGVSAFTARSAIIWTLQRKGWTEEARAALLGATLDLSSQAMRNYREMSLAAERLATPAGLNSARPGVTVRPEHVAAAIELFNRKRTLTETRSKLTEAQKAFDVARKSGNLKDAGQALSRLMQAPDIAELLALGRAYPQTLQNDTDVQKAREVALQSAAVMQPPEPVRDGADTSVYVAGEDGKPVPLPGRYRLVEMSEVVPSHNPAGWAKNEAYPEGWQERAYHRDKSEQAKVENNAATVRPEFTINTNPDATNGPPVVDSKGIVLGGNSRTMSLQLVYERGGDNASKYKGYLAENAHQFGLRPEDVQALERPMLVREVDTTGHDPKLLVRQLNENFTQAMDPRTMQVAMGRRLDSGAMEALASGMDDDETLSDFLDSSRSSSFISTLQKNGIIDRRNANQYIKDGKLNEDGKVLVEKILVGRVIDDADMLSDTKPSLVSALARAVPYVVQAEAGGKGYHIREDLKTAMHAYNEMKRTNVLPGPKDLKKGQAHAAKVTAEGVEAIRDMFRWQGGDRPAGSDGRDHPVTRSPRARALLDVLIQRSGPTQIANVFREYARMAKLNPEGQGAMFGDTTPDDVFRLSIQAATDKEAKKEVESAQASQPVVPAAGLGLFSGLVAQRGPEASAEPRGKLVARKALDNNDTYKRTEVLHGRERNVLGETAADRLHDAESENPEGIPSAHLMGTVLPGASGDPGKDERDLHDSGFAPDEIRTISEHRRKLQEAGAAHRAVGTRETMREITQTEDEHTDALVKILQKRGYKIKHTPGERVRKFDDMAASGMLDHVPSSAAGKGLFASLTVHRASGRGLK